MYEWPPFSDFVTHSESPTCRPSSVHHESQPFTVAFEATNAGTCAVVILVYAECGPIRVNHSHTVVEFGMRIVWRIEDADYLVTIPL